MEDRKILLKAEIERLKTRNIELQKMLIKEKNHKEFILSKCNELFRDLIRALGTVDALEKDRKELAEFLVFKGFCERVDTAPETGKTEIIFIPENNGTLPYYEIITPEGFVWTLGYS